MQIRNRTFEELINDRIHNRIRGGGMTVQNAAGPKATLRIYDEIGFFGITAEDVAKQLDQITAPELEVQISSLGGDVFDGVAIFNALRAHPATVTTRVDSMAASIASVIAQAGEQRVMLSGSQMMVHPAWGITIGNAADMRKMADTLDKQTGIIAGIYAEASDQPVTDMQDMMQEETWMDAQEAVDAGLADVVLNPSDKPADRWSSNGALLSPDEIRVKEGSPHKFSDQLEAVVTAVEAITEETRNVVTFRSQQGKPPLSDEAAELVERFTAALSELADVASEEKETSSNLAPLYAELERRRY